MKLILISVSAVMTKSSRARTPRHIPPICSRYNSDAGCGHKNCQHLHVCLLFARDQCWNSSCHRAHSVMSGRNMRLLEQNGWRSSDQMISAIKKLRRQELRKGIEVCANHNLGICRVTSCPRLHVCYRHVLDACPLQDCDLSHDVKSAGHNAEVLESLELMNVSNATLLRRLRQNLSSHPPCPSVCRADFGQRPSKCRGHCLQLHWCRPFALGTCETGDRCSRDHSLQSAHNRRAMLFFGWTEADAQDAICMEALGDGQSSGAPSVTREDGSHEDHHQISKKKKLSWWERRKAIRVCISYNLGSCRSGSCSLLHVCYRQVLDACPLEDCDLSHDVKSAGHNAEVLESLELMNVNNDTLFRRLRQNLYSLWPSICYSNFGLQPSKCRGHCLRLHWCEKFALGRCADGDRCSRGHSLQIAHNQRAMLFFGWTEADARAAILRDVLGQK